MGVLHCHGNMKLESRFGHRTQGPDGDASPIATKNPHDARSRAGRTLFGCISKRERASERYAAPGAPQKPIGRSPAQGQVQPLVLNFMSEGELPSTAAPQQNAAPKPFAAAFDAADNA